MRRAVLLACLMGVGVMTAAQPSQDVLADIDRQRNALAQKRASIVQEHDQMAKDCWQKFAVNDCLSAVRRSRRTQLDPIHQKELELNAQERAWRTQQRDERLQNKRQESGVRREQ